MDADSARLEKVAQELESLSRKLEADRLLLGELRKEVPTERAEAQAFLNRIKQLAAESDPIRLVPLANRVIDAAPDLFDWIEADYQTEEELIIEYYLGGARAFHIAFEQFRKAALMTVVNRLDVIIDLTY